MKARFRTPAQYRMPSVEFDAIRFDGSNEAEVRSVVPSGRILEIGFWYFKLEGIVRQVDDETMRSHFIPEVD